jgi:hypothetical protein
MNHMTKMAATLAAAVALFGPASSVLADGAGRGEGASANPLLGTWTVVITPYNCGTGIPSPPAAFRSLFSFADGGVMTETTSNQTFQPGQRSIGLGYWERTGRTTYRSVFEAFVQFNSPPLPPGVRSYVRSVQRFDQGIDMVDADHWTGTAAVSWSDFAGNPIENGCANVAAERLQ